MSLFRQYIAPVLIVLVFLIAMIAVSARAFLPGDMASPAPVEEIDSLSVGHPAGDVARRLPQQTAQFYLGQFYLGQFYLGQFHVG